MEVVTGYCGLGLGLACDAIDLVLSQQTDPLLQFDVCGIRTDGLSQNAAMIFSRQNPGHIGPGSRVTGLGVVVGLGVDGIGEADFSGSSLD